MSLQQELLVDLLRDVSRGLGEHIRNVLTRHNLPLSTVIIMKKIEENPGITISELARQTGLAKSHISNIIEELTQQGRVEKRTDPADQRILRLFLSKSASAYLELIRADIRRLLSTLVSGIPEKRTAQIIEGLQDIQAALKSAKEKTGSI